MPVIDILKWIIEIGFQSDFWIDNSQYDALYAFTDYYSNATL